MGLRSILRLNESVRGKGNSMKTFLEIVKNAVQAEAGEVFLLAGQPVTFKTAGKYCRLDEEILTPPETEKLVQAAYDAVRRPMNRLNEKMDDQFAVSFSGLTRVRVSVYRQRNSYAMNLRMIPFGIPDADRLGIPQDVMKLTELKEGLVLLVGPMESGKSTTMACLLDRINQSREGHILTVEAPIEYLYKNARSFVSQREVGLDAESFAQALSFSRWQSPDVIMVSEVPDGESLRALLQASNNRPLVLTAVTAKSVSSGMAALIGRVPAEEQTAAAREISRSLQAVVFQQLLHDADGSLKPSFKLFLPDDRMRRTIAAQDYYLITC